MGGHTRWLAAIKRIGRDIVDGIANGFRAIEDTWVPRMIAFFPVMITPDTHVPVASLSPQNSERR